MAAADKQQKLADRIIRESRDVDLGSWLRAAKPRTKTVPISNDPELEAQVLDLVKRMDGIAAKVAEYEASDHAEDSHGIAEDPAEDLRADWDALNAEYEPLRERYEATVIPFVVRALNGVDVDNAKAAMTEAGAESTDETRTLFMLAERLVSPRMDVPALRELGTEVGIDAVVALVEAMNELDRTGRREPSPPLSLRP